MARFTEKLRRLKPRKKTLIGVAIGASTLLLFLVLSAEYTSRPAFCTTCHYMEPYYQSWQLSTHQEVTCVKCHFPPGVEGTIRGKMAGLVQLVNYMGRSYTRRKPWAEIEDASCLQSGCHETRLLEGKVPFQGVVFDHKAHLGELRKGKQLRCTSCHSQVVQGEHILVTETTCFLCHMKQDGDVNLVAETPLSDCKTCHDWSAIPPDHLPDFRYDHTEVVRQDLDCMRCHNKTIVGDGFVPLDNCVSCHFEAERLDKYDDSPRLHRVHITENKIECTQCHLRIQHKIQQLSPETELDCGACHDETHKEQVFLFAGRDANGYAGTPNPMFEVGLNCASCHVFHEQLLGQAGVQKARPQSCEGCHGEGYAHLLQIWETTAETRLRQLDRAITGVERTVRGVRIQPDTLQAALAYVDKAKYAMHLVQVGKAVHNLSFSDQLIRKSYENLGTASKKAGVRYTPPASIAASTVPSECANCHTGVEELSVPYRGRPFSHNVHTVGQDIECKTCHSNARQHGELVLTAQQCNSCHHRPPAADNCASCHQTETAFYAGTYRGEDTPDYMFDAEIPCADCHVSNNQVRRPDAAICLDCHDDEYVAMAGQWQREVRTLAQEVRSLLDGAPAAFKRTADYDAARSALIDIEGSSAQGVHNYELTTDLLKKIKRTLQPTPPDS